MWIGNAVNNYRKYRLVMSNFPFSTYYFSNSSCPERYFFAILFGAKVKIFPPFKKTND